MELILFLLAIAFFSRLLVCVSFLILVPVAFSATPAPSPEIPDVCVDRLVNVVMCLNSTATESGNDVHSSSIVNKCNSLSLMSKCGATLPDICLNQAMFKSIKNVFQFASRIASACNSPAGRQNIVALTDCNKKVQQNFEHCFNFTVIDQALSFSKSFGDSRDFAEMCCVIKNGQNCYAPIAAEKCGLKGKEALDSTAAFLIGAMECDPKGCR